MSTVLKNKNLLIVEDAQPVMEIVKTVLKNMGALSTGVGSVSRARECLSVQRFDAVILDRYLDDQDGHELLKYLKKNKETKDIPVIMLTGENEMAEIKASLSLGAEGYIAKPFRASSFLDQLEKILRRHSEVDLGFK